jgi:Mn2+/Fe2+ NRAMP family transporter
MSISAKLTALGPGLMYAGAAIGVSHIVQSTKAGAQFGYGLLWALIIANFFKFPFFEIGPRYAAVTGKGLIDGYKKIGPKALWTFILLTLATMLTIQAAVTVVTAGLASHIIGFDLDLKVWVLILLFLSAFILAIGKFSILDNAVKVIIVILTLSTIASVIGAFSSGSAPATAELVKFDWSQQSHVIFLIAFMGWMPAPMDISLWHSEWSLAANKENKKKTSLKDALFDFHIGYWGCALLAIAFLSLGAKVMYGSGVEFSPKGTVFAGQLIDLYGKSLGEWALPIISIAALTTMLSTTLTCLDAFPRVLTKAIGLINTEIDPKKTYNKILLIVAFGTYIFVAQFMSSMGQMVQIATTLSFITAPVLAFLNLRAMNHKDIPAEHHIKGFRLYVSYAGLLYLGGFALYFIVSKF